MRIAHKIVLLAVMALAAMALAAASASAQETEVEANFEGSGPCNPCSIHIEGESRLQTETGIVISRCSDEFEGTINSSGAGTVTWSGVSGGVPGCNLVNCFPPLNQWAVGSVGELGAGIEHLTVFMCVQPLSGGQPITCGAEIDVTDTRTHHYLFDMNQECAANRVFVGSWEIEDEFTHDAIELVHHD